MGWRGVNLKWLQGQASKPTPENVRLESCRGCAVHSGHCHSAPVTASLPELKPLSLPCYVTSGESLTLSGHFHRAFVRKSHVHAWKALRTVHGMWGAPRLCYQLSFLASCAPIGNNLIIQRQKSRFLCQLSQLAMFLVNKIGKCCYPNTTDLRRKCSPQGQADCTSWHPQPHTHFRVSRASLQGGSPWW